MANAERKCQMSCESKKFNNAQDLLYKRDWAGVRAQEIVLFTKKYSAAAQNSMDKKI